MNTQQERVYLAIDLGAESGRVVAGVHRQGKLELDVVHRFPNVPVNTSAGMHWDLTGLFEQILTATMQLEFIDVDHRFQTKFEGSVAFTQNITQSFVAHQKQTLVV